MATQKQIRNTWQLFLEVLKHTAKNDFDKLPIIQQERVVGRQVPHQMAN